MIEAGNSTNLNEGFEVADGALVVSHLQFAYDTLIFCDADLDHILNLKAILLCCEACSGLKVFFKSEVIGVSMNDIQMGELADVMGCKIGSLPTSYMGLPLCLGAASRSLWNPVIER
eukprot:TRINITY_DN9346_c0_g1_i4.p1 TRINITY_DN9346_c0_g1~~TRINITY_DN9346_c0_g1_i4.p1  ORF type:complete len:117 (-),score=18.76 TRINITY_DN9346_c0_g1_i4:161-511(-)